MPAYVTSLNGQFDGLFNKSGRAYPDIAAQAYHFLTIWNGTIAVLDGTSAATPTAASIISLVNDALIASGKPVLGFLNPWLYSKGYKAFTDITEGSIVGCNTTGFPAQSGWDAASGFGTPVSLYHFTSLRLIFFQPTERKTEGYTKRWYHRTFHNFEL